MAARALASLFSAALAVACAQEPAPAPVGDTATAVETGAADLASAVDAAQPDGATGSDGAVGEVAATPDATADGPADVAAEVAVADATVVDTAADTADDVQADAAVALDAGDDLPPDAQDDVQADVLIGPAKPEPATLGPPVAATAQLLYKSPVSFAAAGEGPQVLAQAGTLTMIASDPELPPVLLGGAPGKAHAVAVFASGQLLVASDTGIYGAVKNKLLLSPLANVVVAPPLALFVHAALGKPWLWVVTQSAVWRHDGAVVQALQVQGQDAEALAGAVWRAGPDVAIDAASGQPKAGGQPTPAVWLYLQGAVQALVVTGNTGKLWVDEPIAQGVDLRCDGAGQVWLRAADGTVHRRNVDGSWQWLALPEAVTALVARPDLPVAALQTATGLWLHQDGVFFPVTATAGWNLRDLTATGTLVVTGSKGLARLVPGEVKPPPPPSWAATVEPIFKARCANCHGPTAVTVKLHTAALWQQWYAKVLVQLDTDAMPLLPPKLNAQEKALIKTWGKGGFAP